MVWNGMEWYGINSYGMEWNLMVYYNVMVRHSYSYSRLSSIVPKHVILVLKNPLL